MRVFHQPQLEEWLTIQTRHPEAIRIYHEMNKQPVGPSIGNIETWQVVRKNAMEMIIAEWGKLESLPIFDQDAKFDYWEDEDKLGYSN